MKKQLAGCKLKTEKQMAGRKKNVRHRHCNPGLCKNKGTPIRQAGYISRKKCGRGQKTGRKCRIFAKLREIIIIKPFAEKRVAGVDFLIKKVYNERENIQAEYEVDYGTEKAEN